jgi:hypothetical protein
MPGCTIPITRRVQALVFLEEGIPVLRIIEHTGLTKSTIFRIKQIATEQGYGPKVSYEATAKGCLIKV